jgi:site-specific DNA recombinase
MATATVASETAMRRAVGYIRVSQERNARNGYGLAAQENEIGRFVEYRGLQLAGTYREAGASGYERERPELDRLLADAREGRFDVVVFPSIDRAGRSVKDVIEIDAMLRQCGVEIVFLRENIDTSTPTGELYRNIMAAVAQFEGRLMYERMSKGKRRKAAAGGYTGGYLPYGYRREAGRVVVDRDEARVVERIFRWRGAGVTVKEIVRRLNQNGTRTKRGGHWSWGTVKGILANRFYTGRVEFEGRLVRAQHDAIVADVVFDQAGGVNGETT